MVRPPVGGSRALNQTLSSSDWWWSFRGLPLQGFQPVLVLFGHVFWSEGVAEPSQPAVLILLCENEAPGGTALNQPGVVGVDTRRTGAPSKSLAWHEFFDLGIEPDTKGRPTETRPLTKVRSSSLDYHLFRVPVPCRPEFRANEPSPDNLRRHQHLQLVMHMDFRAIGAILLRPANRELIARQNPRHW